MRINLFLIFMVALIGTLYFPELHLFYFAPYLVLAFYKRSLFAVLWRAIGCGLIIDLFSSSPHFGITSLNYCIVSTLLYSQTRNFFEDKISTLFIMTFFFSVLSTLVSLASLPFFLETPPLSLKWAVTDLAIMPAFDGLYALFLALPFQIAYQLRRQIRAKRRAR